jgi:hypothetical protein
MMDVLVGVGSLLSSHDIVLPRDSMHDFTTNKRGENKKAKEVKSTFKSHN